MIRTRMGAKSKQRIWAAPIVRAALGLICAFAAVPLAAQTIEGTQPLTAVKEYDMIEFDLANVANYAELAILMAPRPFMVERGDHDGVAPDEWVAFESSKVRRSYISTMHAPEKTEIEFFDGPHTINGKGIFEFLRRHLKWPPTPAPSSGSPDAR